MDRKIPEENVCVTTTKQLILNRLEGFVVVATFGGKRWVKLQEKAKCKYCNLSARWAGNNNNDKEDRDDSIQLQNTTVCR